MTGDRSGGIYVLDVTRQPFTPALARIQGQAEMLSLASTNALEFSVSQGQALYQQAETILDQVVIIEAILQSSTYFPHAFKG